MPAAGAAPVACTAVNDAGMSSDERRGWAVRLKLPELNNVVPQCTAKARCAQAAIIPAPINEVTQWMRAGGAARRESDGKGRVVCRHLCRPPAEQHLVFWPCFAGPVQHGLPPNAACTGWSGPCNATYSCKLGHGPCLFSAPPTATERHRAPRLGGGRQTPRQVVHSSS